MAEQDEHVNAAAIGVLTTYDRWRANVATIGGGADNMQRFEVLELAIGVLRAALAAAPAESRQPDGGDSLSADEVEQLQTAAAERRARPLLPPFQPAGTDLIVAERRRQVEAEGWTPEYDDGHERGELVDAAICYARLALGADPVILEGTRWPWGGGFKPGTDERNLARAGALIAAEIDRLQRAAALVEEGDGGR